MTKTSNPDKLFGLEDIEKYASQYKDGESAIVNGKFLRFMVDTMRDNKSLKASLAMRWKR